MRQACRERRLAYKASFNHGPAPQELLDGHCSAELAVASLDDLPETTASVLASKLVSALVGEW